MNGLLDSLRRDHLLLEELLEARRGVSTETMPRGVNILWQLYLQTLQEALSAIDYLIDFLTREPD
jgi:hypothetical protein